MSVWVYGCMGVCLLLSACTPEKEAPIELPQIMNETLPFVYPIELWDNRIQGQVMLSLRIADTGAVDSVVVTKGSGYAEFDSAAVKGARVMQFTPGKQGERRVAMWTKLPVTFARDTVKMGLGGE